MTNNSFKNMAFLSLILLVGSLLTSTATAKILVTFFFSGVASGSIGGNNFSDAVFVISITGDPDNVQPVPGFANSIRILSDSATISIAGVTSTINTQLSVFRNTGGFVGLALPPTTDLILGPSDDPLATYDLISNIDLITSDASFGNWNSVNIDTANGQLIFEDDDVSTTFSAGLIACPSVILGDVNQDGTVNFLDISPFIAVLSGDGFQEEADINRDEVVNFLDISPLIDILSGP